ncbi:MAG: signal peptidase I [Acidobacteriota bacterium]|nr:signal peptidase I [Acidobacteriota bacterium]
MDAPDHIPAEAPSVRPEPRPPRTPSASAFAAISWLRDLTVSVLIAVVVILFLYQPVRVEGTSMMPSLVDQERIFINKFAYRFGISDINRGDTVVFWFPGDPSKSFIKRVIGVPGDKVEVTDGKVSVNETVLDEPYVPEAYRDHVSTPLRVVPPGEYFVLGDHRSSSNDSRMWGTVPRHFIYGKAAFVYWPLERMGLLR